jgi:hypothetical protein
MIDHEARAELHRTADDFLSDRIGAFTFDDRLFKLLSSTRDETVRLVIDRLWRFYDDTDDHLVRLNKQGWDSIQRFLLLLDSDAELYETQKRVWHVSQLVALGTLVMLFAIWIGMENPFVALLAAGTISMGITAWRQRVRTKSAASSPPEIWPTRPFPSLSDIQRALDRTPAFRKRHFRTEIAERSTRSRFGYIRLPSFIEWPLSRLGWCFVSPIILFFQCLPICVSQEVFQEPNKFGAEDASAVSG